MEAAAIDKDFASPLTMDCEGRFHACTKPQKAADGESVITLLAGSDSWQFGKVEDVLAAMILTDGVYDKLASKSLQLFWNGIDCDLTAFFMSPWAFDLSRNTPEANCDEMIAAFRTASPNEFYSRMVRAVAQGDDEEEAKDFVIEHILQGNRPLKTLQGIQDDISVAVMQNRAIRPSCLPMDYYLPPDWEEINRRIRFQLFGNEDQNTMTAEETTENAEIILRST